MKIIKLLLAALCFVTVGLSQTSCQQSCDNIYNTCNDYASQQLNNCLANNSSALYACTAQCSGPNGNGCPSVTPASCADPAVASSNHCCGYVAQCYTNYNNATAVCDANYPTCSNNCADQVPPSASKRKLQKHPGRAND